MENYMAKFMRKGEDRPESANREMKREHACRDVKHEFQITYEMGYERDPLKDEPMSNSMMETQIVEGSDPYDVAGSDSGFSRRHGGPAGPGGPRGRGGKGGRSGAMSPKSPGSPFAGGGVGGGIGGGGEMTKEQKKAFIADIKNEMRDMVNSICNHFISDSEKKLMNKIDINDRKLNKAF